MTTDTADAPTVELRTIDPSIYRPNTDLVLPLRMSKASLQRLLLNQDGLPVIKDDLIRLLQLCSRIAENYSKTLLATGSIILDGMGGARGESIHFIYDIVYESDEAFPEGRSIMDVYLEDEFCSLRTLPSIDAIMKG